MALNIQRRLMDRQCNAIDYRILQSSVQDRFSQSIYSDNYLLSRMTLQKELIGHAGCVNTLFWSQGGDKLLSGSDDTKLRVWKPWHDYQLDYMINTGHQANIFSAKFMPGTSDSIAVSAAGDAEVRVFDVNTAANSGSPTPINVFTCHGDRVKRIELEGNPFEFLTCSDDETVRHFDLRMPHICTPHQIKSFLTASRRPSRRYPPPVGDNVTNGCPKPLLDYSRYKIEINTLSINKLYPQYISVGGMDDYLTLHDRRMIGSGGGAGKNKSFEQSTRCVKRFSASRNQEWRHSKNIAACKFSDANSQELIGSWLSGNVYLFNIHDSASERTKKGTLCQSHGIKRVSDAVIPEHRSRMKSIIDYFVNNELGNAQDELCDFLCSQEIATDADDSSCDDTKIKRLWTLCLLAAVHFRRVREVPRDEADQYYVDEDIRAARQYLMDAETQSPKSWRGLWCLAVGYWIASGGQIPNGCEEREDLLVKSVHLVAKAQRVYRRDTSNLQSSSTDQTTEHREDDNEDYDIMMDEFRRDIEVALFHESMDDDEDNSAVSSGPRWKWLDYMYIKEKGSESLCTGSKNKRRRHKNSTLESSSESSSIDFDETDTKTSETQEESDRDEHEMLFQMASDRAREADLESVEDTSHADDSDDEYSSRSSTWQGRLHFESDAEIVSYRSMYQGHCNIETSKDVNFYGPNDEYIVSGSDDGLAFIWDKKTTKIVQILKGDEETVNVIQGHPTLPIMAVSGIDDTIKIFSPTSEIATTSRLRDPTAPSSYSPSSRMYDIERILARNLENNRSADSSMYVTRHMIAAISQRLQERRWANIDPLSDDEDMSFECSVQ